MSKNKNTMLKIKLNKHNYNLEQKRKILVRIVNKIDNFLDNIRPNNFRKDKTRDIWLDIDNFRGQLPAYPSQYNPLTWPKYNHPIRKILSEIKGLLAKYENKDKLKDIQNNIIDLKEFLIDNKDNFLATDDLNNLIKEVNNENN